MKKREIWTISRLSKVPEAQCEILIEQNYEKNQNKWIRPKNSREFFVDDEVGNVVLVDGICTFYGYGIRAKNNN
jgi:hypothetical protein